MGQLVVIGRILLADMILAAKQKRKNLEGVAHSKIAMRSFLGLTLFVVTLVASTLPANAQVYTASDNWTVGNGDYILDSGIPGCGVNTIDPLAAAAKALASYYQGGIYGSLSSVLQTAIQAARPQTRGALGQALDLIYGGNRYANCVPVSVAVPAEAEILSYQFEASDDHGSGVCTIGQDCQIGWSRFDSPETYSAGGEKIIVSNFRNWSGDRTRNATMTVTFRLPQPPSHITITNNGDRVLNFSLRPKDGNYKAFSLSPGSSFNYTNADFVQITTRLESGQAITKEYGLVDGHGYALEMNSQTQVWDVFNR